MVEKPPGKKPLWLFSFGARIRVSIWDEIRTVCCKRNRTRSLSLLKVMIDAVGISFPVSFIFSRCVLNQLYLLAEPSMSGQQNIAMHCMVAEVASSRMCLVWERFLVETRHRAAFR